MKIRRREINYPMALWRRRWWIVPFVLLGLVVSLVLFARLPRIYRTQATVILIPQTISKTIYDGFWRFPGGRLKGIQEIVTSTKLLEAAARELGMETPTDQELRKIVAGFQVKEVDPETFLFVKVGPDPQEIARRVNAVARAFVEESRQRKIEGTEVSSEFLQDEIARLKRELRELKERLALYQAEHKGELPSDREAHRAEQAFLRTRISELDARVESKRKDLQERQNLIGGPAAAAGDDKGGGPPVPEDPRLQTVASLRKELATARLRYTDSHPQIIRIQASLDALLEDIRSSPYVPPPPDVAGALPDIPPPGESGAETLERYVQLEMARIRKEIDELGAERGKAQAQIESLERKIQASYLRQTEIDQINGQVAILDQRLISNQNRLQGLETEREVFERGMDERFSLKAEAGVPILPFSPDLLQFLLMGLAAGAGLGVALALGREFMDSSVWTADEVEDLLQAEILAVIPNMDRERKRRPRRPPPGPARRKQAHG